MSYTVGIKRKFWPGYRKVMVTAHSWENFRFILNLTDGSQLVIPGFHSGGIKVYSDFKSHIAVLEDARRKAEYEAQRRHASELRYAVPEPTEEEIEAKRRAYEEDRLRAKYATGHIPQPTEPWLGDSQERTIDPQEVRARANAKQRVSSILASNGPSEGLADRPSIGGVIQ